MKTEKNKLTNLFKIGTLLLGLSLLLLNCKKEEILIEYDSSHYGIEAEYSKEIISFSSFKSSNKTYDLFFTKLETNKTLSKKTQEYTNFNYITAIDKSEVISFIGKNKKTFTFPIVTSLEKEKNEFFNLVIEKENGISRAVVIKYNPIGITDSNDLENFQSYLEFFNSKGKKVGLSRTVTSNSAKASSSLQAMSKNCDPVIETLYKACDCGGNADGHESSGASCCKGSATLGYKITYPCNSGGGSVDSASDNGNPLDSNIDLGNIGDISEGGGNSGTATSPLNISKVIELMEFYAREFNIFLNPDELDLLFKNQQLDVDIRNFIIKNNTSEEAKSFAQQVIKAMANNTDLDLSPYLNSITATLSGTSFQDYDPNDPILGNQILLDIVNNAIDGFGNLILIYLEYKSSNSNEGKILRVLMPKMGLEIPADVSDETLGELFSLRKRDRSLVVEYQDNTLKGLIIDVAVSAFDVVALISPSKGGGAYLLASGGSRVTAVSLSNLLKSLKNRVYTLRGPMVGKRIGHTFKEHGSHLTEFCRMRAINGNINVGQWLDDAAAESFIARHLNQLSNGARDIPIPPSLQNIGRSFRKSDGAIFTPTHIRLVPSGSGVSTAFPINSTLTPLNALGVYIP